MKKKIIILVLFCVVIFVAYRVGLHNGYNYTVPAIKLAFEQGKIKGITKQDIDKYSNWVNNARARDFGNYCLFKPDNDSINALWVTRKKKPFYPYIIIEEKDDSSITNIAIYDKSFNSFYINYDQKKQKISSLSFFFDGGCIFDFNGNGNWDLRSIRRKDNYSREVQIDSIWYTIIPKKKTDTVKKNSLFIKTKDGIKEVFRSDGDYYIKSEQK